MDPVHNTRAMGGPLYDLIPAGEATSDELLGRFLDYVDFKGLTLYPAQEEAVLALFEGRNVILALPVAPWEAALGAQVEVPTLGGPVQMKIPAGARAGQRLRLNGRGLPGKPPGDELVTLEIVLPPGDSAKTRALYEQMRRELDFDPRADLKRRVSSAHRGAKH